MRTTIDFGIDLGTTNSAIAVLNGVATDIIKNNWDQDVTPSAVSFGKNSRLLIGNPAKGKAIDKPRDAYVEFKRRMGTDFVYEFHESGLAKKPEELSAEILKSLRADVSRTLGEEIRSAVITVPAAFELHQCDATRKAAELAGFSGSRLLQEPVAAALAYGFQTDSEKAYWLVYDFGGGTFDAALIKAEDGLINVVHHGGDNFLGGSNIDWAILERIIAPKLAQKFDLPDFRRGSDRWEVPLHKLKHAIETAKIEVTTRDTTFLMGFSFEDESGETIDAEEIALTQAEVIQVAEPIIRRSVEICHRVLREKNISARAVERVILVGGPTKAPYFRKILQETLGVPLDFRLDPLTVVARGAAIFAGTQKLDKQFFRAAEVGEFQIDLKYNPVGHEVDPLVGGKVSRPGTDSLEAFTLELVNTKTQWRSGRIALRADGTFVANLLAERGERNVFQIELLDPNGAMQKIVPDRMVYTVGAVIEEQPLINSMGVALANNEVVWFFKRGAGLPLKKKSEHPFVTTKTLKVGDDAVAIRIPVIEGENAAADRNRMVGYLDITSGMIKRDLPYGSEVELTLKINASRIITVYAYIRILDEEFESQVDLRKLSVSAGQIETEWKAELARLKSLRRNADPEAKEKLDALENSGLAQQTREAVAAAHGDVDAANEAEKLLLEFKLALDAVEDLAKWPSAVSDARDWLEDLEKLAAQHGTPHQRGRAAELRAEMEEIIRRKEIDRLNRKSGEVEKLYFQILVTLPSFWVNQFQRLEREQARMSNQTRAQQLVTAGQNYLGENNVRGLESVVRQLWDLLPRAVAQQVQRGYGSGLA